MVGNGDIATRERAALCDLLDELGPDAPTLCEGWTTADLAAHLVLRESRPDAAVGIVVPPLAPWTDRVQEQTKRTPFPRLVERLRSGPPLLSPFRVPVVGDLANATEFVVHHEDVRRGRPGWQPRELPVEWDDRLWKRVQAIARLTLRNARVGVVLRRPDLVRAPVHAGQPEVTVTGPPLELLLYVFGRRDAAVVEIEGDPDAVRQLAKAPVGV